MPKTTREAVSQIKKVKRGAGIIKEGKGKATSKARKKQDKEARDALAALGERSDDVGGGGPSGKGKGAEPPKASTPALPKPAPKPKAAPKPKPSKPTAISQPKRPDMRTTKRESTRRNMLKLSQIDKTWR